MKKLEYLLIICLMMSGLASCSDDKGPRGDVSDIPELKEYSLSRSEEEVKNCLNEFGFDMMHAISRNYNGVYTKETTGNMSFSPLSAGLCFGMVANGCDESAESRIAAMLRCKDMDALNSLSNKLIRVLSHKQDMTIILANGVWYNDKLQVSASFESKMAEVFYARVVGLDITSDASVDVINGWVAENTNNHIDKVIDSPAELGDMVWVNAMYAAGEWNVKFDKGKTHPMLFHGRDISLNVPMMYAEGSY